MYNRAQVKTNTHPYFFPEAKDRQGRDIFLLRYHGPASFAGSREANQEALKGEVQVNC